MVLILDQNLLCYTVDPNHNTMNSLHHWICSY